MKCRNIYICVNDSKIFQSVVSTSNHWCMRKWRSRPTFTWANLCDFWSPMKVHISFVFSSSGDFWKREYLYNVTFWKKNTRPQTWKWRLVFLLLGHFFLFSKISFAFSNYVINTPSGVTYERVLLPVKLTAGADKASIVRRGDFSNIWLVKSHYCVTIVRAMKYISQHCCDKTMDRKMALNFECCFPNCTKSWWIKLLL